MSFLQCGFYSNVLDMECQMNVIMPTGIKAQEPGGGNAPVLYLLHGFTEDHTAWTRRTAVERYVLHRNLAVVMPNVHRSFYTDMHSGGQYFTFITEELPAFIQSTFHVSDKREDTFVAGLSMGGYGAFKIALSYPERYAGAASLSGAMDIRRVFGDAEHMAESQAVFGTCIQADNDLYHLAERCAEKNLFPKLYQCCGTEDFLYEDNIRFRDFIAEKANDRYFYTERNGAHTWDFWEQSIQDVLRWIERINPAIKDR